MEFDITDNKPFYKEFNYESVTPRRQVQMFTEAFGQDVDLPTLDKITILYKLLIEELVELGGSLGFSVYNIHKLMTLEALSVIEKHSATTTDNINSQENRANIVDAIIDMQYYEFQLIQLFKLRNAYYKGFAAVTKANMNKLGEDGKPIISDGTGGKPKGKILKPDGWKPADMVAIVKECDENK